MFHLMLKQARLVLFQIIHQTSSNRVNNIFSNLRCQNILHLINCITEIKVFAIFWDNFNLFGCLWWSMRYFPILSIPYRKDGFDLHQGNGWGDSYPCPNVNSLGTACPPICSTGQAFHWYHSTLSTTSHTIAATFKAFLKGLIDVLLADASKLPL